MIEILRALGPMPNANIASQHSFKVDSVTFYYTIFSFADFTELTDFVAFMQSFKDSHRMQVVGDRQLTKLVLSGMQKTNEAPFNSIIKSDVTFNWLQSQLLMNCDQKLLQAINFVEPAD